MTYAHEMCRWSRSTPAPNSAFSEGVRACSLEKSVAPIASSPHAPNRFAFVCHGGISLMRIKASFAAF